MVTSVMCMCSTTSLMVLAGQGEPAMIPVRRVRKSNLVNSGCSRMAMNMVGTPYRAVQCSRSTLIMTFTASNRSRMTMVAPWLTQAMTPRTQPKQWNSGTGMQTRSAPERFWLAPIQ